MRQTRDSEGFTLIELLVVVAIIGLLSSVVLVSLNSARKKARNAKRVADIHQIQSALELYYLDNNSYPNNGLTWANECSDGGSLSPSAVIPGLVPNYMAKFPSDPLMNKTAATSCYTYASNGTDYKFLVHNATENSAAEYLAQRGLVDPRRDGGSIDCTLDGASPWAWAVYSPSACSW